MNKDIYDFLQWRRRQRMFWALEFVVVLFDKFIGLRGWSSRSIVRGERGTK